MLLKIFLFINLLTFSYQNTSLLENCNDLTNTMRETYFWNLRSPNEIKNSGNESNHGKNYLFGSIHVSWNLIWDFVPSIVKDVMLNKTEIAVFEHDLLNHTNLKNIFKCLNNTEPSRQAQNLLSEDLLVLIEKAIELQASTGIVSLGPLSQISVRKMPPDWIYISLLELVQQHEMIALKGIPLLTLDYYLQEQMFNTGHILLQNIENLNDNEKCPMVLPSIGKDDLSNALQVMLKVLGKVQDINTKQPNIASTRIQLYKCGLLNSEEGKQMLNEAKKEFIGPDLIKIENIVNKDLVQLRNKQWANQIDQLISKTPNKTFMFTFSVDHFIGKNNLLDLLRERGYQIEKMIKIPKIDKKILKQIKEDKISLVDNLIEEKNKNRTLKNNLNQTKLNKNKIENIKRKNKLMETTTKLTSISNLTVSRNYSHMSNFNRSKKFVNYFLIFGEKLIYVVLKLYNNT
uniref:Metalloprotease TIKI homolog n=1 Tax=Meloidogyne enterolobii TaxID=390850 RepID=A0A6V7W0C2_MELEN|nr:unnamed protein product [Meloidogyne enterolobii]